MPDCAQLKGCIAGDVDRWRKPRRRSPASGGDLWSGPHTDVSWAADHCWQISCDLAEMPGLDLGNEWARLPSVSRLGACTVVRSSSSLADRSFDMVVCSDALEILAPDKVPLALLELRRVCRRNLYLSVTRGLAAGRAAGDTRGATGGRTPGSQRVSASTHATMR